MDAVMSNARIPVFSQVLREQSGAALIETALVLPIFLLLLFGFFTFSIVLFGFCNATYAARVGARFASLNSSNSATPYNSASVSALLSPLLYGTSATNIAITTVWTPSNAVGSMVKVSVTIAYPLNIPFLNMTQLTVGSSAQRIIVR